MIQLFKKIARFLHSYPWPWTHGMPVDCVPAQAKFAWGILTAREWYGVSKYNPFIKRRDNLIRALHARGLGVSVLAEISGLSDTTISRITKTATKDKAPKRAVSPSDGRAEKHALGHGQGPD